MIHYIRERTAAPYFSNLVKFVGQHVVELNTSVRQDSELVTNQCCGDDGDYGDYGGSDDDDDDDDAGDDYGDDDCSICCLRKWSW